MKPITLNNHTYYFECASKMHSFIVIKGLLHSNDGLPTAIEEIKLIGAPLEFQKFSIQHLNENGMNSYRFSIEAISPSDGYSPAMGVEFTFAKQSMLINILDIFQSIEYITNSVSDQFFNSIKASKQIKLLDIGGRARSGLLRSSEFSDIETTVLDIVKDDGVDVVADAHDMSSHLKNGYFDACMCISVFEHLIMPWKVVLEMNKVMKIGGICLIATHQTVGMHDMPWDYYRFSDSSWSGLFNKYTGFEIIDRGMSGLNYIIPFAWSEERRSAEKAAGFESSVVLVKKISNSKLKWPLLAADVISDTYPQ